MTIPEPADSHRSRFPMVARIITAMVLGALVGSGIGTRVSRLGEIGSVIIDLIKALAGPLLFFAVIDAFLRTQVKARSAGIMVAITMTNAAIAVAIGLTLSNTLRPGDHLDMKITAASSTAATPRVAPAEIKSIDFLQAIEGYLPRNILQPFLDNSVITIVVLAVLIGAALRHVKNEQIAAGDTGYRASRISSRPAFARSR